MKIIEGKGKDQQEIYKSINKELSLLKKDKREGFIAFHTPGIEATKESYDYLLSGNKDSHYPAELLTCGYVIKYDGETIHESPENIKRVLSSDDMLCRIFYMENEQGFIFNKLFRSDIINRYNLNFRTDLGAGAERLFLTEYIKKIRTVRMLPRKVMTWNMDNGLFFYDENTVRSLKEIKKKLIFKPDARWIVNEDIRFFKEEEEI